MIINAKANLDKVKTKLANSIKKITYDVSSQVLKDSNYYIPKREGDLESSSHIHSDLEKGKLEWNTPYARRLYWNPEYNFSTDVNPNASGLWFERAKSTRLNVWNEIAKRAI